MRGRREEPEGSYAMSVDGTGVSALVEEVILSR